MTTLEKNKIIAEFMNALTVNYNGDIKEDLTSLKYHTSWNELMPVVEKIESLNMEINEVVTSFDVTIEYGDCNIQDEDRVGLCDIHYHSTDSKSKIEAVYNAVVEFILWYNKNKTQ